MQGYPQALQGLVRELTRLPSIGEKTALRLAYHLVTQDSQNPKALAAAILEACEKVQLCARCFHLADQELCQICRSPARDAAVLCIVEKPADVFAVERLGEYQGQYHVLHTLWAPLRGQGPEQMRLEVLVERVKEQEVREVILALSATVEGDATALYLARLLADEGVRSTRLAQGMPKGGELEYADEITLSRAFAGRREVG